MSALADDAMATRRTLPAWHPLAMIVLALITVIAVYWQSYLPMVRMWSLDTYQYGWLVFPISLVMLWHVRERINAVRLEPSGLGVAALAAVVMLWVMASAVNVQVIEFGAATLMVPALVWALGGTALLRAALFPLVFLIAAVPVGEALIPALMRSTADIATWMLDLAGVPAFRENMYLTLPGGNFEVADVCSGLRYLLVGTVIAILFAYWNYNSLKKRILFVAAVAISFIIANGVRAFIVMYVASATDMRVFAGRDHIIFGQILFLVLAMALMYAGSRYADDIEHDRAAAAGETPNWRPALIVLAVAIFAFGPLGQHVRASGGGDATLPLANPALAGCGADQDWQPDWRPVQQGPAAESAASWQCGDTRISLYQAAYREQAQGRELISSANALWPYDWRRHVTTASHSVNVAGAEKPVTEVFRDTQPHATLIWYWYVIDGTATNNPYVVKLLEALHALKLRTPDAALVMIVAEGDAGRDELAAAAEQAAGRL